MDKETTKTTNNIEACLGFTPVLFFLPLLVKKSDDEIAKNAGKQGVLLLISFVALAVIETVCMKFIPYEWNEYFDWAMISVRAVLFILLIVGMVRSYNNKIFKLPIIGNIDVFEMIKGKD